MDIDHVNIISGDTVTSNILFSNVKPIVLDKQLAVDRWIDDGKEQNDQNIKFINFINISKPCNNYNYSYNKLQTVSIITPVPSILPSISPPLWFAFFFFCKDSNYGNKEKDLKIKGQIEEFL